MPHYLCRLNPPRPTFATDMTPDERRLMGEHGAYWSALMGRGRVEIFGFVADPGGAWGVTIVDVEDEEAAHGLTAQDPVILSRRGFSYEIFAMPNAVTRSSVAQARG